MMTEQVNSTENFAQSSNVATSNNFSSGNAQPVNQNAGNKVYYDDDVNRIAGIKKQEGKQQGYKEGYEAAKSEWLQQQATPQHTQQNFTPAQNSFAPVNPVNQPQQMLTVEQARALAKEEIQNTLHTTNAQMIINNFLTKVNTGASKVENFDYATVEKDLNLPANPVIWTTAGEFDNPAQILNEIWKDPSKYAELKSLSDSPAMVRRRMQQLAESLKQNEEAEKARVANPPLSRQKPSTVGVDSGKDKSEFSVQDWKQIFRK